MNLKSYKRNIYSQNGEDGIVLEIFKRLEIVDGIVIEFGAADGLWLSNTAQFWREKFDDYSALLIEGDKEKYEKLLINTDIYDVITINTYVAKDANDLNSLKNILDKYYINKDFELLSIDIDSYDYELWKGFIDYNPKVVIVEANSSYGWWGDSISDKANEGTSPRAMVELGKSKGYELAAHCGNLIFVRNDLFGKLNISNNSLQDLWDY